MEKGLGGDRDLPQPTEPIGLVSRALGHGQVNEGVSVAEEGEVAAAVYSGQGQIGVINGVRKGGDRGFELLDLV